MTDHVDDLLDGAASVDGDQVASLTMRLLNRWTPPGDERSAAELLAAELRGIVDEVVIDEEFSGSPSLICRLRGRHPGPTLQWHGHLDAIATPHTTPTRDGDLITGRGAADMKGALAAMVVAAGLLRQHGFPRAGDLLITFHGLHEEGGSRPLLRLFERGIVGDGALIGELASGPVLITASGGLSFWDMDISSGRQPVHETNRSDDTPDLLAAAVDIHRELQRYSSMIADRGGSVFIGSLSGGDYYNRVPVTVALQGTRRHSDGETLDQVKAEFEGLTRHLENATGMPIRLRFSSIADAYRIDPNCAPATALRTAYAQLTGLPMRPMATRSVGNAAHFVRRAGIPAVYHGADYASAHSDNEHVSVAELTRLVGIYALATASFLQPAIFPPPPPLPAESPADSPSTAPAPPVSLDPCAP